VLQKQPTPSELKKKRKKRWDGFGITGQQKRDCSRGSTQQEKENLAVLVRYN